MSSNPRGRARTVFWKTAGQLLAALRERRDFTQAELARRAGVPIDIVTTYEQSPERYPELEAWWRLTTALGVDLMAFLRQAEKQAGATILMDVTPLSLASPSRPAERRVEAPTEDQLSSFIAQIREKKDGR